MAKGTSKLTFKVWLKLVVKIIDAFRFPGTLGTSDFYLIFVYKLQNKKLTKFRDRRQCSAI